MTVKELALTQAAYSGSDGNLGYLAPETNKKMAGYSSIKWESCRESFAGSVWEGGRSTLHEGGFLFYHGNKTTEDITEFIERFETLLEIGRRSPLIRSKIQKVSTGAVLPPKQERRMTWCEPGPFWMKQTMRFSLLTMLLRCANFGYVAGGDFWTALFASYNLAMGTKNSIARFLDGYTWYKGKNDGLTNGWYNTFHQYEQHAFNYDAWKVLVRPKPKEKPVEEAVSVGSIYLKQLAQEAAPSFTAQSQTMSNGVVLEREILLGKKAVTPTEREILLG